MVGTYDLSTPTGPAAVAAPLPAAAIRASAARVSPPAPGCVCSAAGLSPPAVGVSDALHDRRPLPEVRRPALQAGRVHVVGRPDRTEAAQSREVPHLRHRLQRQDRALQ